MRPWIDVHSVSVPPEQDMVAWLRSQILARKATAEAAARESGDEAWSVGGPYSDNVQTERQSSPVVVGPWAGGFLADPLREHIAFNDPQDTIARCEYELWELSRHRKSPVHDCALCGERDAEWPCESLRRLAYAYRRLPGWRADWAPESS